MALRGASVEVDARRVGHAVVGICLTALAATVIVLFVAGIQKNAQITRLRRQGVAVEVTVSGCLGLMGGSGSNLAGYECKGTFSLDGHRYSDAIPGSAFYSPGNDAPSGCGPRGPCAHLHASRHGGRAQLMEGVRSSGSPACHPRATRGSRARQAREHRRGAGSDSVGHCDITSSLRPRSCPPLNRSPGMTAAGQRACCFLPGLGADDRLRAPVGGV